MKKVLSRLFLLALLAVCFVPAAFAGDGGVIPPEVIAKGYQLSTVNAHFYTLEGTENGSWQTVYSYEYDQNGNPVKRTETKTWNNDFTRQEHYECVFDSDGNCIEEMYIMDAENNSEIPTTWYTYDHGRLIREEHGTKTGNQKTVSYFTEYTYDSNGDLSSEKGTYWTIHYVRQNGQVTEALYTDEAGNTIRKAAYSYKKTSYGTEVTIQVSEYYGGGLNAISKTIEEYDNAGNHIKLSIYGIADANSAPQLSTVYEYGYEKTASQADGWQHNGSAWYYYENGTPVTGWKLVDGVWYYFNNSGVMQTGWVSVDGVWYYMNGSGAMQTGWLNDGGTWYYLYNSGAMATGWLDDGAWYYLNGSGAMATGWASVDGVWYYLNGSGAMQTGWLNDGGTWYYLYNSGAMATGWLNDGAWYYLTGSGAMATGWASVDGVWYYLNGSGAMQTGWLNDGGTWYYLDASGAWVG